MDTTGRLSHETVYELTRRKYSVSDYTRKTHKPSIPYVTMVVVVLVKKGLPP